MWLQVQNLQAGIYSDHGMPGDAAATRVDLSPRSVKSGESTGHCSSGHNVGHTGGAEYLPEGDSLNSQNYDDMEPIEYRILELIAKAPPDLAGQLLRAVQRPPVSCSDVGIQTAPKVEASQPADCSAFVASRRILLFACWSQLFVAALASGATLFWVQTAQQQELSLSCSRPQALSGSVMRKLEELDELRLKALRLGAQGTFPSPLSSELLLPADATNSERTVATPSPPPPPPPPPPSPPPPPLLPPQCAKTLPDGSGCREWVVR